MIDEIIHKGLERYYDERETKKVYEIHESLPVVDSFCKNYSWIDNETFSGLDVCFIQHCFLGPFKGRINAMVQYGGLDLDRVWLVDIPYSSNEKVRNELLKICSKDKIAPKYDDPLVKYKETQNARVKNMIRDIAEESKEEKLLFVDDGAYFIRNLMELKDEPQLVDRLCKRGISVVEQTTRGHRYFTEKETKKEFEDFLIEHKISVVSIARTKTKIELESPFIGAAVSSSIIENLIHSKKFNDVNLDKILINGFGPVGEQTTKSILDSELVKEHNTIVDVSEKDPMKAKKIKKILKNNGGNPLPSLDDEKFEKSAKTYDAIIGCTGYRAFHPKDIRFLAEGAILASGSSATVEFNREAFLDKLNETGSGFNITNKQEIEQKGLHSTIKMEKDSKRFSFLNAGFPVNFDGGIECVPYWAIQMTHALLIAASQETLLKEPGFYKLSSKKDVEIYETSLNFLKKFLFIL